MRVSCVPCFPHHNNEGAVTEDDDGVGDPGDDTRTVSERDGRRVLTASDDGTARRWDAGDGCELAGLQLAGHDGPVRGAAFSSDGKMIVTVGHDRAARLWDGIDGRLLCILVRHETGIHLASFSPGGRVVVVSSTARCGRSSGARTRASRK
jgi:WD40 repeat protein